jgi:hypothetical protein
MEDIEPKEWIIKVGDLYWRDYDNHGRWPWTGKIELAERFNRKTVDEIIKYWQDPVRKDGLPRHHDTIYKSDDSILASATSLGGVLPLNAKIIGIN